MADVELCNCTITELAERIASRDISPVEVTEAHLARIDALNPALNAFTTVAHDRARNEAAQSQKEVADGKIRGPLHGVPIGIKDIIDTEGVRTTQGSSFFSNNVPDKDAECVRRLRDAGAIIIGKCNTAEFAAESATKNPHHGACRNPWDASRVPAGSSGGSGAAVAARMVPGALGTDTGGSVRGPAAICGTVGLKPTYGRVSVRGVFPNATSLDHVGPLTRTVQDCAIMLQAIAGHDAQDPFSPDVPVPDFSADLEKGVKGLRLMTCPDLIDVEIDKPIADAFDAAVAVFRDLGAEVEPVACPFAEEINPHRRAIADAEFYHVHRERYAGNPDGYGIRLQERIANAEKTTLDMYIDALNHREMLKRKMIELMRPYHAMLSPGYPCLAAPVETTMATVNGKEMDFIGLGRNLTGVQNFLGFPGLSVPTGFDAEHGLPMAIQITTMPGGEALGFRIGHAYEQATPGIRERRPAL
ncbi:MAG: amidase [Alphaproteobacteria bacterium]|nr:amidase [Alphaproteobacteria bacterium]